MNTIIPIIRLVVALQLQYVICQYDEEDYPWEDYVKDQVHFDDDFKQIVDYGSVIKEAEFHRTLPTSTYTKPEEFGFGFNFDAPYFVIFYSLPHHLTVEKLCGGVLLTGNVAMTLCSCVAFYLKWIAEPTAPPPPYALPEDLGTTVFLGLELKNFSFIDEIDFLNFTKNYPYKLLAQGEQFKNEKCLEAFKGATASDKKAWQQRTSFAILKFNPDYINRTQKDIFMPWPPRPILYDLTLKDKEVNASNLHWGLHRARPPQTVAILSYYAGDPPAYKGPLKDTIIVNGTLAYMLTTMCDQDYCENDWPELLHPEEKPLYATRHIGCFCDYNPRLCQGLYGSPIVHNGLVYGLLISPVKCSSENPRATIGQAISIETMDWIAKKVPGIFERLGQEANSSKFREGAIVSNYEVDIPMADLMPSDIPFTEDDVPEGLSDSHTIKPSDVLLLGFLFFSLCLVKFNFEGKEIIRINV